ncbi:uncharacterized protein BDZ99DRAFT_522857 [Mytilinidion resinicola]|uniref:BTB domain-containing protein n=1 Tax=Mytilinidion resinicola TaxID=574789 RepID=A0A6A6YF53_9PEZI|nr:uncharacterized protein BDZ99DRAFT_522857 [Mytilinidion resinicola]KAF2807239.1 hypothetical protein BDZ99DRAFT_522857 [Mytilinidion resinicola]
MLGEPATKHEDLLGGIRRLDKNELYSDLTITCGGDVYKAHNLVVCSQSSAEEGRIDLPEDDPWMVERMIYYFYHLDYLPTTRMNMCKLSGLDPLGDDRCPCISATHMKCSIDTDECLITHSYMYSMGDRFGSPGLRDMASAKFTAALVQHGTTTGLPPVIPVVCATTPDSDPVLRTLVAQDIVTYKGFLEDKILQISLREHPVMAYYVLRAEHPDLNLPLPRI